MNTIERLPGAGLAAGPYTARLIGRCGRGPHWAVEGPGWSGWRWTTREAACLLRRLVRAGGRTEAQAIDHECRRTGHDRPYWHVGPHLGAAPKRAGKAWCWCGRVSADIET